MTDILLNCTYTLLQIFHYVFLSCQAELASTVFFGYHCEYFIMLA